MHLMFNRMRSTMPNALTSDQITGAIRLKLEGEFFSRIEEWRRSHSKIPSRTDAIRQLVERGLAQDIGSSAKTRDAMAMPSEGNAP